MALEKHINARIPQKIDSELNWDKAINFIPMKGEIIVYSKDENYSYDRIKIGDGIKKVKELPFINLQSDWNQNDSNAIDYVKNRPFYAEETIEKQVLFEAENFSVTAKHNVMSPTQDDFITLSYYNYADVNKNVFDSWLDEITSCQVEFDGVIYDYLSGEYFGNIGYYIGFPELVDPNFLSFEEDPPFCLTQEGRNTFKLYIKDNLPHNIKISLPDKITREIVPIPEEYLPVIQSDWNQTDDTQKDFIKNKPEEATDEEIMDILLEVGIVYEPTGDV